MGTWHKARNAIIRGRQGKGSVAMVSAEVDTKTYTPMQLLSSRDAHIKAMAVSLEAANAILPSPLYAKPMLSLVDTLAIL